jgi:hypothetical protein
MCAKIRFDVALVVIAYRANVHSFFSAPPIDKGISGNLFRKKESKLNSSEMLIER